MKRATQERFADAEDAILAYEEFHDFPPEDIGHFHQKLVIPRTVYCVGEAQWIAYRSNKWEREFHNYIHEHEGDVWCYRTDGKEGKRTEVPSWIREAPALALIGGCLGFRYRDHDGYPVEAETRTPLPEVYCIKEGDAACLLVIEDKRSVRALIWGGGLDVKDVGIVG